MFILINPATTPTTHNYSFSRVKICNDIAYLTCVLSYISRSCFFCLHIYPVQKLLCSWRKFQILSTTKNVFATLFAPRRRRISNQD